MGEGTAKLSRLPSMGTGNQIDEIEGRWRRLSDSKERGMEYL